MEFKKIYGSRAEVYHGLAEKTTGGLYKKDLMMNKRNVIISRRMSERAQKEGHLGRYQVMPKE